MESVEQNNPPHKTSLTTFVVFSAGQIIHMLFIPGKKFLKINDTLSKIFCAKSHVHFLP